MMRFHAMAPLLVVLALIGLTLPAMTSADSKTQQWRRSAAWISGASLLTMLVVSVWAAVWARSVAGAVK